MSEETQGQNDIENYRAQIENTIRMKQIVANMKQIPELPSEVLQDINPLLKVEFPEAGGILTYMGGYEHPYKGFPFHEFVDKIDIIKKVQRGVLSSMYHSLKARSVFQKMLLVFVPWIFSDFLQAMIYTFYRMIDRFKIWPIRYCTSVRELHRAFSVKYNGETAAQEEMRLMIRDFACMFLEFDNAYRFRFQDVIVELDKEKLKRNPGKEVTRLLTVMSSREKTQDIKDTWKLVQFFLPIYLFFNKPLRKGIIDILSELDLEKTALSIEDKAFCEKRKDYNFKFLCHQTRSISEKESNHPGDSSHSEVLEPSPSGLPPQAVV